MCLGFEWRAGHEVCLKWSGTERRCGSHHAAWGPVQVRNRSEGAFVCALRVQDIPAWASTDAGMRLCPIVIGTGVNRAWIQVTRAKASGRRIPRQPLSLLVLREVRSQRARPRSPRHRRSARHLKQHFFWYQQLARDQVQRPRQVFQTTAQPKLQCDSRAQCSVCARIRANHDQRTTQSHPPCRGGVALTQNDRYFVPNEVLLRVFGVTRGVWRQRHDSCLCPG